MTRLLVVNSFNTVHEMSMVYLFEILNTNKILFLKQFISPVVISYAFSQQLCCFIAYL